MSTKHILLLVFCCLSTLGIKAANENKYSIHIIDYSLSWISSMHYYIDNESVKVEEVDNVDGKKKVVYTRPLSEDESELTGKYMAILSQIKFPKEYVNRQSTTGERNQKRINLTMGDETSSVFILNTYQQDLAAFIAFLNSFIDEQYKMKEFVDPNKPIKRKIR